MDFIALTDIHKTEWNLFVESHPTGNFFQTVEYYSLYENDSKSKAFAYGVFNNNKLIAIVAGVIESNLFTPINKFTKRAIIRGGPLVENNDSIVLEFLLDALIKKLKKESVYIQIRNLFETVGLRQKYIASGFDYVPHLDILIDVSSNEEIILKGISSGKRGNINKSTNKGTKFKELKSAQEVSEGIELIIATYKKAKLPVPDQNFFLNAYEKLEPINLLKVFGAYCEDTLIGVRFELLYNKLVYDWYAGSDLNYKKRYPNDFLPYNILLWAHRNKYEKFDFGGAGKPGIPYGVRDHKIKFGGEVVEFGRYLRINRKFVYYLGNQFFKIIKKIKE